jgi:hypothetical protein
MIIGNSIKNSLSIKIADKSSGFEEFDGTKFGGLRFGTRGYLGVRVNNNNSFSAWNPLKNGILYTDEMTTGSRGLRIYGGESDANVLGVQLTTDGKLDNGELRIDMDGCLRLSSGFNMKNLNISDGHTNIPYNGSDEVTITFGPGFSITASGD